MQVSTREAKTQTGASPGINNATRDRKAEHIRINLEQDISSKGIDTGFEAFRFLHCALPEIDLAEVDTGTQLFDQALGVPILISCMTGGTPAAQRINLTLAEVAEAFGLAMGLGSARVLLEHPEALPTFRVRPHAPHVPLLANLGAVQLNRGVGVQDCRRLVDLLEADGLVLHFNALQEALQPEGDTCFSGLLTKVTALVAKLERPVIAKEVGWGMAPDVVRRLLDAGVSAIDVAGAGGTSWSEVERHRMEEPWRREVAAAFAGWGIPTAEALQLAREAAPNAAIFASGGIRDGIEVAKAVALGADLCGIAGPFLRAAARGAEAAAELARTLREQLRIAMFCVGASNLRQLRRTPRLLRLDGRATSPHLETLSYSTSGPRQFIDITDDVAAVVKRANVRQGMVHVYSNHTTAAIRINENEPLLLTDFQRMLERLVPSGDFCHDDLSRRVGIGGLEPINGHSHCQHLLMSTSETIPVIAGGLALGRWQRIFLVELCSARRRELTVQILG